MIKFKIKSYKSKKYFWVYVHDSEEEFKREAKKYHRSFGEKYRFSSENGLFHPFEKFWIDKNKEKKIANIGIIRLIKDKLYPRTVYHEVVHAAFWQFRVNHRGKADFGDQIDKREEELAHSYNQLLSCVVNKLYKLGLWE